MDDHTDFWNHLAAHHGVIDVRDAASRGVTHKQLTRLVEVGALDQPAYGVYRATGHARTPRQRVAIGVVAAGVGRGASCLRPVATRQTATWLWGVEPRDRDPSVVHVLVPNTRMPSPDLSWLRVHRSRTLRAEDIVEHRGTWVTRPTRTTVDSAINRSVDDLSEITARSLQRELYSLDELSSQLETAGRIRGSTRLREAVRRVAPDLAVVESVAEAAAARAFADHGLDLAPQFPVEFAGRHFRLDFAAPTSGLAIEIDGHWWHSTPAQKARDDRRQNHLAANGWRVLRFGAGRVMRHPDAVAREVRAALSTRWSA